jgi:arylsulfatase A-like enzyme
MENGKAIAAGIPTLGEIFRDAGYKTAYAGKWHLPRSFDGMTGFEKIAGGSALGEKMDAPVADACSAWLRQHSAGPFLLVASFMNPHDICSWIRAHPGSRRHADLSAYPPAPSNMAPDPREPDCIQYHRTAGYDLMSQAVGIASEWRAADFRHYLHDYYRMVEHVDRHIATVLAALRGSPHAANTIVCLTSDHGEGLGAHRWVQKASFYEDSVRVPLLLSGPGIPAGRRHDGLASLIDILPTFCDYAGLPVPAQVRGQSLRPLIEGAAWSRDLLASELRYGSDRKQGRMIRSGRYKYVRFNSGDRPEQLFDLDLDPGETRNLAPQPDAAALLADHRRMLLAWQKETGDSAFA